MSIGVVGQCQKSREMALLFDALSPWVEIWLSFFGLCECQFVGRVCVWKGGGVAETFCLW